MTDDRYKPADMRCRLGGAVLLPTSTSVIRRRRRAEEDLRLCRTVSCETTHLTNRGLVVAAIALLIVGFSSAADDGFGSPSAYGVIIAGAVLMIITFAHFFTTKRNAIIPPVRANPAQLTRRGCSRSARRHSSSLAHSSTRSCSCLSAFYCLNSSKA